MNRFALTFVVLCLAGSLVGHAQNGRPSGSGSERPYVPVTDEMLWKPDPANWLSWRRTLD
jgi:hypothetical protein